MTSRTRRWRRLPSLAEDHEAAPQLLLIAFDDNRPVADCIPGERLVILARAA